MTQHQNRFEMKQSRCNRSVETVLGHAWPPIEWAFLVLTEDEFWGV